MREHSPAATTKFLFHLARPIGGAARCRSGCVRSFEISATLAMPNVLRESRRHSKFALKAPGDAWRSSALGADRPKRQNLCATPWGFRAGGGPGAGCPTLGTERGTARFRTWLAAKNVASAFARTAELASGGRRRATIRFRSATIREILADLASGSSLLLTIDVDRYACGLGGHH